MLILSKTAEREELAYERKVSVWQQKATQKSLWKVY